MAALATRKESRWGDRRPNWIQESPSQAELSSRRQTPLPKRQPKWVASAPEVSLPEQ
jgi:hypothetical protein